jgi:hypothetical protein
MIEMVNQEVIRQVMESSSWFVHGEKVWVVRRFGFRRRWRNILFRLTHLGSPAVLIEGDGVARVLSERKLKKVLFHLPRGKEYRHLQSLCFNYKVWKVSGRIFRSRWRTLWFRLRNFGAFPFLFRGLFDVDRRWHRSPPRTWDRYKAGDPHLLPPKLRPKLMEVGKGRWRLVLSKKLYSSILLHNYKFEYGVVRKYAIAKAIWNFEKIEAYERWRAMEECSLCYKLIACPDDLRTLSSLRGRVEGVREGVEVKLQVLCFECQEKIRRGGIALEALEGYGRVRHLIKLFALILYLHVLGHSGDGVYCPLFIYHFRYKFGRTPWMWRRWCAVYNPQFTCPELEFYQLKSGEMGRGCAYAFGLVDPPEYLFQSEF